MNTKAVTKVCFFALVILSGFFIAGCKKKVAVEDQNYNKGVLHMEKQEYSAALLAFKNSINENPINTDSYIRSSDILRKKHNYEEAISILENGKDFVTEPDLVYQSLGELFLLKNDYIHAEENFRKSIGFDSGNAKAVEGLASSLVLQLKFDDGKKVLANYKTTDKDSLVRIKYLLAVLQAKDIREAKKTVDSINVNMKDYVQLGKLKLAIEEAEVSEDNKIEDLMNISFVVIDGGDYPYALPLLDEVVKENEYYYGGQMYAGYIHMKLGQYSEAKEFLQKALILDSENKDSLKFLAECYVELNDQKSAIDTYVILLSLSPSDSVVRRSYIEGLLRFGIEDIAKEQAGELVRIEPSIANRLYYFDILMLDEDYVNGAEQIRLASEGEEYKTAGDTTKADLLARKGWIQYKAGEKAAGLETLEQSLREVETNPLCHLYLGMVRKDMKEPVNAKIHLERAVDLDFKGEVSKIAREELNTLE
ncbi:tetratricopeptide repeat protein [Candidatus Dojkabacteria bacterium]|nr:tetratricopeptide repeat protein [Candidatus Dojkabacteria bacterium]